MLDSQSTLFECPNCAAKYKVVRVEAPEGPTTDREIICVSCGGPLDQEIFEKERALAAVGALVNAELVCTKRNQ
jgi:hypothetical protein